ncbi:fimbrial biogenesis chaperone [Polaribacter glomeratus]|uniref:Molecular chaperone n=1 Tax=Polaribacter glomeratus TaxID=102 RepID=A0A2S7WG85_9FLAO|nr:molecular chaperone [Polaribacter glomeratus]PQJ76272.1 hypothetical protein BTO16_10135 [Polaribacter glomeratus]TXD63812.1 molecular chaperone [Polaribacter glomeratus]
MINKDRKDSLYYIQVFKYLLFFVFISTVISPTAAQGNLLIYPKRLVFEGRNNIEKLILSNTGKDSAVYNISFIEYRMNETGDLKIISKAEAGLNSASSHVRFFPRKVILGPYESQKIKVQVRNTQSLEDGEYRSHLYFRAEEDEGALRKKSLTKKTTMSVKLKAVFGVSIPCILRKGINTTKVSISDLELIQLPKLENVLQFNLKRTGNMSAYGDFIIKYITPNNKVYEVAKMQGVGVYTPGNFRTLKVKLQKPDKLSFNKGAFKIIFTANESKKILAEARLML